MTYDELKNALRGEVKNCLGNISVLCQNSDGTVMFEHNCAAQMPSASLIKVPILLAALKRGEAFLQERIPVCNADILPDSRAFYGNPRFATVEELCHWMIMISDNTATNMLISLLGFEEINDICTEYGLQQTVLTRKMLDLKAVKQGRDNYTSAADMAKLFLKLCGTDAEQYSGQALAMLRRTEGGGFRKYIWQDIDIAHKTGGLSGLSHDAGLWYIGKQHYFLGVLVSGSSQEEGDLQCIGNIAKLIYEYQRQNVEENDEGNNL